MSMNWAIKLPDGREWYVGSWAVPYSETAAQVIIPVEQIDGMSCEEIGWYVLEMVDHARHCNAEEYASEILTNLFIAERATPERQNEIREALQPYADRSEKIALALAVVEGTAKHPLAVKRNEPKPKAKRNMAGYIYLLRSEMGQHKIGRTKDLPTRIKTFGIQLPFKVELVHSINAKDMHAAETMLHERYAHCRVNGEWFDLTADDVAWITSHSSL